MPVQRSSSQVGTNSAAGWGELLWRSGCLEEMFSTNIGAGLPILFADGIIGQSLFEVDATQQILYFLLVPTFIKMGATLIVRASPHLMLGSSGVFHEETALPPMLEHLGP